ncbi:MAG: hypothetical protein HFJ57_02095 [Clostridia bacterium]|nr:hypothetical protein [Clostridia bacterium]
MDNTTNKSELLKNLYDDLQENVEIAHDLYYRSKSVRKPLSDEEVLQGFSVIHEKLTKIQASINYHIACARSHGNK